MSRTQSDETDADEQHVVNCTECDYREVGRSKVHAYALGRKHYHEHGHPVGYSEGGSDE